MVDQWKKDLVKLVPDECKDWIISLSLKNIATILANYHELPIVVYQQTVNEIEQELENKKILENNNINKPEISRELTETKYMSTILHDLSSDEDESDKKNNYSKSSTIKGQQGEAQIYNWLK